MTIDLLPAARIHSPILAGMHKICFVDPWSEGGFVESLQSPGTWGLIAVANQSLIPRGAESGPAGLVMWRMVADEAEILTIAVLPPWRRQGLGARMLQAALDAIGDAGIQSVFLEVAENNPAGQQLYKNHGFLQVGRRSGYYQTVDALVMRRQVSLSSEAT